MLCRSEPGANAGAGARSERERRAQGTDTRHRDQQKHPGVDAHTAGARVRPRVFVAAVYVLAPCVQFLTASLVNELLLMCM